MHLLNLFLLYFTVPHIIANDITILTDWKKSTLQCIKFFLENSRYLITDNTNVTISGLDEKGDRVIHNIVLRNINELSRYHQIDYLPQERNENYYSKLINAQNQSMARFLLFGEKSMFSKNSEFYRQNEKNLKIVKCENGICENCTEQKPIALAIVNNVPEAKIVDSDVQIQPKNEASDKSWSNEKINGPKSFTLELSPLSILTGISGETVKLYFRVMNTQWLPMEFTFNCYDQLGLIRSVLPTRILLQPNSPPFDVMVVLEVIGSEGSTDQISFEVLHPEYESFKVNFYIGKLTGDTTRPTINYIFNGDCRFADTPHTCASEKWSIEATIQDENSGLAMISSIPNRLQFRNQFSIGTRDPVIVYYTATCCFPKIEIIATDLRGNSIKKTIDADKQYLNMTEIALIVLLAILVLIIIIILIWTIIKCQKRRRSRDFLSS